MDNTFLRHDPNAMLVFLKLLLIVNRQGQWSGGRRQLATLLDVNERTLYDILLRLEAQQMIKIEPNHRYSVISICKWTKYQA